MKLRTAGIVAIIVLGILGLTVIAGTEESKKNEKNELISWKRYDEGIKIAAKENKPVIIDFYTNWCGYCKKMDRETFAKKEISDYINLRFVAIKVNAESGNTLSLPSGNTSEVQLARSFGVTGYPTYWFLRADGEKIDRLPGYQPADRFIHILRYIGDGHYKSQSFKDYYEKATNSN